MKRFWIVAITSLALSGLGAAAAAPAGAVYGGASGPPGLGLEPPFGQCAAVYLDPSCGYLIDIGSGGKLTVISDPEVGFYEGSDDVLVGVQNDSGAPVSSIHVGVPGSGTGSFAFDGDGLCTPGGGPVPDECPFGPSSSDPFDYYGPDAELAASSSDDGTVTFPAPLQPGQYTYFSLESYFSGASVLPGGSDFVRTSLTDGTNTNERITDSAPINVTDTATLVGVHAKEAPVNTKVTYHLYSDPVCSKEILVAGKPAGGVKAITTEGELPKSEPVGAALETNHVYYWRVSYEGDSKGNEATETNCGDETMTFGTPPVRSGAVVSTTLSGSNGAKGSSLTVYTGTSVSDSATVAAGGTGQPGRVTYFVFSDAGCTAQVSGARLGGAVSSNGVYGSSSAVTLGVGTYYFQAIYSGTHTVSPARSACGSEVLTVVPPPPKCTCSSLHTFMNHFSVYGPGTTRLGMRLNIALACTTGVGGCSGEVIVHAPEGAKFIDTAKHPKGVRPFAPTPTFKVGCAGPCVGTTLQRVDLTWLAVSTRRVKRGKKFVVTTVPIRSFLPHVRAKKSKVVLLELICNTAAGPVKTTFKLTIKFDKHGQVSYKLSDLDGNGVPDGKQLSLF